MLPLWGNRSCVSLYGTSSRRPVMGRPVSAPPEGTSFRRPFMGRPFSCAPLWGVSFSAPLWGNCCAHLRDVFSVPRYGATVCAPLYGTSLSVPLYGAAAAPLYGTSFRRPFMGLPVGAPLYGASFRCPFMGRPLIMWVCVPYLFARVLRLACRRFPGFCEPIGCSRHTKLVCCT